MLSILTFLVLQAKYLKAIKKFRQDCLLLLNIGSWGKACNIHPALAEEVYADTWADKYQSLKRPEAKAQLKVSLEHYLHSGHIKVQKDLNTWLVGELEYTAHNKDVLTEVPPGFYSEWFLSLVLVFSSCLS